jgi:hypothetical protein
MLAVTILFALIPGQNPVLESKIDPVKGGGGPEIVGNPPIISYTKLFDRQLIGVNNPEQIYSVDLGDANRGNKVLYRATLAPGKYRDWFSHVNRSGFAIGHGVSITNPDTAAVTITNHGKGFFASILGGRPFSDMFNSYSVAGTKTKLLPGQSMWLWRNDASVPSTSFFSGVIDFDVSGGLAVVDNVAYQTFANLTGTRAYTGYITRVESDGSRQSRVYKGLTQNNSVLAPNINYTITSTDTGALPVRTSDYNLTTQTFGALVTRNYWISNIGPAQNGQSVTSDMVSWAMPGWGTINPLRRSDADNNYPNLGNWGVTYILTGSITNNAGASRTIAVNLQAPAGGGCPIAYRSADGVWRSSKIDAGLNQNITSFVVPNGATVAFDARYILGGPGAGTIRNTVTVNP